MCHNETVMKPSKSPEVRCAAAEAQHRVQQLRLFGAHLLQQGRRHHEVFAQDLEENPWKSWENPWRK
jgi:hypothetical protein